MVPPKYALLEHERRALVDPARLPDLSAVAADLIEDLYLDGGRLRLRALTRPDGARVYKLCKKYPSDDPSGGPIANLYLDEAEYRTLARLPGRPIRKRRHRLPVDGVVFAVDVFEGDLAGLVLCEAEADSAAALAAIVFPDWASPEVTANPGFTGGLLCRETAVTLAARLDAVRGARRS